ncbi:DNA ligase [Streptomyces sp. NBC_01264]|uniref:ATP-dependent DNA ligase n=1 Tax=Streptomyces sp. NBC_01264 TaxID=2903804 RepID=UPI00225362DB|nr:DNA ligase [Streptomyces sp. NBC_01264]MCX4783940.1 DNA ligase [Streptomyces sp. NBC_01264]
MSVALAQSVSVLPSGEGWWFEPKLDGHRTVLWREEGGVRLQSRAGRDVTSAWADLARAALRLPVGSVVDGEAVIYVDGRIDFSAAQGRAASSPARAARLAARWPASFAAWDLLSHPDAGDVRARPYVERRALLLEVLEGLGPPLQVVPATDDREVALVWHELLREQGVEGLVAKQALSTYRPSRIWRKLRHAETVDAAVVGYTGPPRRPRTLAVRLPDGRTVLSRAVSAPVATEAAARLATAGPGQTARTDSDQSYTAVETGLLAEVLAGTTRHATVTVARLR